MIPEEKPRLRDRFAGAIDKAIDVALNMAAGSGWKATLFYTALVLAILAGFAGLYAWLDLLDHWRATK